MRHFYVCWEMQNYAAARNLAADLPRKAGAYWRFYFGPLFTIPLVAIAALWRKRDTRLLLLLLAGFSIALVGQVWHNPHYAAPATGLVVLVVTSGMRQLRAGGGRIGLNIVRLLPIAVAGMLLIQVSASRAEQDVPAQAGWRWPPPGNLARARILHELEKSPEDHLVLVRYSLAHDPGDEWVYNRASIDAARVVWARELDRESNAALLQYFAGRRVWLVEPDVVPTRLVPYENAPARPMPFVQVGAPGIAVLRSAEELRQRVLARTDSREPRTCDFWNFIFTQATGIGPADPNSADRCYPNDNRAAPVSFDDWFRWLARQR